jgi:hypothetical protein
VRIGANAQVATRSYLLFFRWCGAHTYMVL